ncbi:MAG: flagellin biosynthesis protein FlgH [Desulfobacterales bacterium]|nr:MAG: flagellin biosynthesis protein FlgH [Desulfobacterales bacterium]
MILAFVLSVGCAGGSATHMAVIPPKSDALPPAPIPQSYTTGRPSEGSLWNDRRGSMFADTRANHVGDTVIVDIVENSSSKMGVNSAGKRTSSMNIANPTLNILGYQTNLGGNGTAPLINTSFNNSVAGKASSDRSGQVTASISARVVEVMPNGNLSLFGRRAMKVDQEVQYIMVSGIIRPQDISATNRVPSTYLADARIEYYGKGALSDKQKPGWGTRIIDTLWPW